MHPTVVDIGWFSIHSYGFMLAVSFLLGIYLAAYRAKKYGLDPQHILDLSVYIIISAVVGSRLMYVVFHLDEYNGLVDILAIWQGGATFFGGIFLAILVSYVFSVKKKKPFLLLADIISPSIALGVVFTRIGCFLSGCCFGKETGLPWGVAFPATSAAGSYIRELSEKTAGKGVLLHPTQLYSSLYGLLIFLVLMLFDRKLSKQGSTFGTLLVMYGAARFSVDFLRYYEPNMIVLWGLTLNQALSLILVLVGLSVLLRKAPGGER